jgi:hypothetical protein
MSHLTPESLARLVDESPTADEAAHVAECPRCRDTLDDLRAQTVALGRLAAVAPPSDAWQKIAARVEADRIAPARSRPNAGIIRSAAAVALFALGAATGVAVSRARTGAASVPVPAERQTPGIVTVAEPPATPDAALMRLRIAELMYTSALLDYAAITSPTPPKDAVARLATLETIVLTTRTALERAPTDPLINSYHLAALAERETLLGQLRRTPENKQWY